MAIKFFDKVADWLVFNGNIKAEEKDIYMYGLQQGTIIILNIITTIIIGSLFGMVRQSILFMVAYLPLRSFAGGYHARTQARCYLYSMILTAAVLVVIRFTTMINFIIIGSVVIASIIILLLAPVEDDNKHLDQVEVKVYKKLVIIILTCELCAMTLLYVLNYYIIALCIIVSIITLAIMLVFGEIVNLKIQLK